MNIGTQLRQARESRGLSIAALASATRISPRILEAIERNDVSVIPPRPYGRGFVSVFAREVGLNADETVHGFFSQFAQPPAAPATEPAAGPSPRQVGFPRWGIALAALAGVLVAGLLLTRSTDRTAGADRAAVGTSGTPHAAGDLTTAGTSPANDRAHPTAAGASERPQPGPADKLVVMLEAEGRSWVTATVDGKRAVYRVMDAGATETLRGSREIRIRVGDAGAMRWSVNGRQAVPMGNPGQVRTVLVAAEN